MDKRQVRKLVIEAQKGLHPLRITYEKATGDEKTVVRTIEPYEMKDETRTDGKRLTYVYGYDKSPSLPPERNHIKKWCANRFRRVQVMTTETFTPKFDMKVE